MGRKKTLVKLYTRFFAAAIHRTMLRRYENQENT